METGSGSESDLVDALERLCRVTTATGTATVLSAMAPTTCSPVLSPRRGAARARGARPLGTWQRVVLVDTNADNPRAPGPAQLRGRLLGQLA